MTLGPSPGVLEDFGAVRSTPTASGDAPDSAAAPGGAKASLFDDLVDAWLAPAADDDADDPVEGVPVAAASPFPITLPLPVIALPPQGQADATDVTSNACATECDAASAAEPQPSVDRAPLASPDVTIDPAPQPHREGQAVQKTARHRAPADSARVEVAKASEAGAADATARNVRDLPGLKSNTPPVSPAASEAPKNDAIDRLASAKPAAQAPAPVPESPEAESAVTPASAAPALFVASSAASSSSPAVESQSNSPGTASAEAVAANDVVNATSRGESATSAHATKKPVPREADRPHKTPQKPTVPQTSGDVPRKASVGRSKIDQPTAGTPKATKAQSKELSEGSALEIDTAGASGVETVAGQEVTPADAPRRSLNLQIPREPAASPAVDAAAPQAVAPQINARAIVPNENDNAGDVSNLDDLKSTDGARVSRNVAASQPDERGRRDTSDEPDRDANRDTWRNSADHTQGAVRANVSQPFVERAEARESSASSSPSTRASVTLVHGTAPVLTQATLLQPPTVASSDAPAMASPAPDTADRIVQSLKLQVQRGGGDAVLHLQPDHLGPVAISLRVENGSVSAVITAEHAGVAEWLQSNQQSLREGLQASGLTLERFVVQRDGQSPSDRQRREYAESRRRDFRRRLPQADSTFEISI